MAQTIFYTIIGILVAGGMLVVLFDPGSKK